MTLSAFAKLESLLGEEVMLLNTTITESFQNSQQLIPQISGHLISAGGKRVRPYLALGIGKLFQSTTRKRFYQAASLELLHSATLIHDDVVDHSDQRRGRPTAHQIWGNEASVLVGDYMFAKAFSMMVKLETPEILDILANTATAIAEGEIVQLHQAHNLKISHEDYIAMISGKTSILFQAATQTAALLANQSEQTAWQCGQFGLNLGIAFQMADDALDYDANQATLGKNIGDDFKEGKISAPALYAYRRGNAEEKDFWKRVFSGDRRDDDFAHAIELIQRHHVLSDIQTEAKRYAEMAANALDCAPNCPIKDALIECAYFAATRDR